MLLICNSGIRGIFSRSGEDGARPRNSAAATSFSRGGHCLAGQTRSRGARRRKREHPAPQPHPSRNVHNARNARNARELVPGPLGADVANVNAHEHLRLLGFPGLHQVHELNVLHGHLAQLAGGSQWGQAEQPSVRTQLGNE